MECGVSFKLVCRRLRRRDRAKTSACLREDSSVRANLATEPDARTQRPFASCQRYCPVPESLATCGLLVALSVIVSVAFRVPFAEGVNVTCTEHVFPAGKLLQSFVWAKSPLFVPVIVMFVKFTLKFS